MKILSSGCEQLHFQVSGNYIGESIIRRSSSRRDCIVEITRWRLTTVSTACLRQKLPTRIWIPFLSFKKNLSNPKTSSEHLRLHIELIRNFQFPSVLRIGLRWPEKDDSIDHIPSGWEKPIFGHCLHRCRKHLFAAGHCAALYPYQM